jgi:hypothetical protein
VENQKVIVFVGDVTDQTSATAKQFDQSATLITPANSLLSPGVYYTSLGDCQNLNLFLETLSKADVLNYVPCDQWSDTKNNFSYMKYFTERLLLKFRNKIESNIDIVPSDIELITEITDLRKTTDPQLWIAGCSFSEGVGVSKSQRYGQLIADYLRMPVSFLTQSGSSISWAADQIIRSDIREGDIVIWGLTSHRRFSYYDKKVNHVFIRFYEYNPEFNQTVSIDRLDDHNLIYQSVISILQVINFCKKTKAKVYLPMLLTDNEFMSYIYKFPNTIDLAPINFDMENLWIDIGDDGIHPGVKTHINYAEEIIKFL